MKRYRSKITENKIKKYVYEKYGHKLFEHSFSRIWQHRSNGFFIISAFRGKYTDDENIIRHEKLKNHLKQNKLGFFEVDGVYIYDDGTKDSELSLFVPFISKEYSSDQIKDIAMKAGKIINQESILFKYPEYESNEYVYLYPNSNKIQIVGNKLDFDTVKKAYSQLRKGSHAGRKVAFDYVMEGVRLPNNHIDAGSMLAEGILF